MSSMILSGDTSGAITVTVPAVAGTNTITLPAATGTVQVSGNQPAFSAYNNTLQSVTSATWTKVTINTETFDTNNNFDSTTNYRFTPTVAGYYQIVGAVFPNTTTTYVYAGIYKNGTAYSTVGNGSTSAGCLVSSIIYFNGSTDYVELYGWLLGTTPKIEVGNQWTYFNGCLIRAA